MDAQKSLLEQDLALTWRYSVGNPYEEFSSAESLDVAEVMGSYGFTNVMRQILRTSFGRFSLAPSNWRMGELMIASARYYELTGDRAYLNWVDEADRLVHDGGRAADAERPARPAAAGAVLLGHPRTCLRAALADNGLGRAERDRRGLGGDRTRGPRRPRARAREPAAGRAAARGRGVLASVEGRLALRAGGAARQAQAVRRGHALPARQLLEPGDAVCPGVRILRAARQASERDPPLHARPRLAAARARARRRLLALRREDALPGHRHRPGLRAGGRAIPRRQRRAEPARAQPLRNARRGNDARDVRLRRGRDGRSARGRGASARCTCRRTPPRTRHSSRRCG